MAVETAFGMRQNANNKRLATLEKSLIASSRRDRSCLFRHLSTVGAQILPYESGVAAPRIHVPRLGGACCPISSRGKGAHRNPGCSWGLNPPLSRSDRAMVCRPRGYVDWHRFGHAVEGISA